MALVQKIGQVNRVSYRFKQHVTSALDKESGPVYDWMRDVWRRNYDVAVYILQQEIIPKDVELFEQYWIDQFANLLNVVGNKARPANSPIANQICAAIQAQLESAREQRVTPK